MWVFMLFFVFVLTSLVLLWSWLSDDDQARWREEFEREESQQAEVKTAMRHTDEAGPVHTDDLRP